MQLALSGIGKSFGPVRALDAIDLVLAPGRVHAVLGENGAGKSTLMNILSGLYRPDEGTMAVDGRPVAFQAPRDALAAGIGMIHQHPTLVEAMTGLENILLPHVRGRLRPDAARIAGEAAALAARLGFAVELERRVWQMPLGMRQRVEILKVLLRGARLVILDEPTSILTPGEAAGLLAACRRLAAEGRSVILITHKLQEVLDTADAVTVLRRGRAVASLPVAGATAAGLARLMVGEDEAPPVPRPSPAEGAPLLDIAGLAVLDDRGRRAVDGLDLSVRPGEIVGLAGVDGNGQAELAEALAGTRPVAAGRIAIAGQDVTGLAPRLRMTRHRLAYVPADRHQVGLALSLDPAGNMALRDFADPPLRGRFGRFMGRVAAERARAAIADYAIKARLGQPVRMLSGGNQQKLVLARELARQPRVLVAEQPCRGLDVAATRFVEDRILALAADGAAILYISTELEEILSVAHRIAVLQRGRIAGILTRAEADRGALGRLMAGLAA